MVCGHVIMAGLTSYSICFISTSCGIEARSVARQTCTRFALLAPFIQKDRVSTRFPMGAVLPSHLYFAMAGRTIRRSLHRRNCARLCTGNDERYPAANNANTRAINQRSIREVIRYVLLGSTLNDGIGASLKTLQDRHSSRR